MSGLRRDPVPSTLMQIWSPIMASVSISLLIVLVPFGPIAPGRRRAPINPDRGGGSERWTCRLIAARVIAVVLALILLNITGAVSGPRPGRSYIPLDDREFFGGMPRMLVIRMEGTTVQNRRLDATDWLGPLASPSGTSDDRYDFEEGTIEYRRDASIVTYAGTAERKLSQPHVISPPARSFLDLWWPLMGTSSVTVIVILCLTRHGLSDAQIPSISGQGSKRSLEVHQHLAPNAIEDADQEAIPDPGCDEWLCSWWCQRRSTSGGCRQPVACEE